MIKIMLKPFMKRYIGLFISMVVVSMLSIGLLCSFGSTITNLRTTFNEYLNEYQDVDIIAKTAFSERSEFADITTIDGVEAADKRLTIDTQLKKKNGRIITSRIYTFNEDENKLLKRYSVNSIERNPNYVNVSIVNKFAQNNGFKLGDELQVGFQGFFIKVYINEIVETPEAIQPRANDYIWGDNTDFGYIYISEFEIDKVIQNIGDVLDEQFKTNPEFQEAYDEFINQTGKTITDYISEVFVGQNIGSSFANQLLIKVKDGYNHKEVLAKVEQYLTAKGIEKKSITLSENTVYILYIENCIKQIKVAAICLPLFFYAVTMVVIALFINQIIKSMTPEIGIMTSIGVGYKDILSIFIIFSLLMSIVAGILGFGIGIGLSNLLTSTMIRLYSIPILKAGIHPLIGVLAIVALIVFAELTTLLACKKISKITPKDATINNEAKRKQLPKWLDKLIAKSPMQLKLGINSIAQNPRRFFVSVFSIFAAFVIILLALFFYVSKTELVAQSIERRLNFDGQIYLMEKANEEDVNNLANQEFVTKLDHCYYTYAEATFNDKKIYLECLAYDYNSKNDLIYIPDSSGKNKQAFVKDGIIIPKAIASDLKAGIGDKLTINGKEIVINGISNQYFHPVTYLSKEALDSLGIQYVSTIIFNTTNEDMLLKYVGENMMQSLTVFSKSLSKDIHQIFDSIDIFIYIIIGFSVGMAFVILSIMGQNALMEQKRQLSIFRLIGFKVIDISNFWTIQSVTQLVFASIFAIPFGALSSVWLFSMCSSAAQNYPFIFDVRFVLIAFLFILFVIILSHLLSMFTIKRWNLADNTRCRE